MIADILVLLAALSQGWQPIAFWLALGLLCSMGAVVSAAKLHVGFVHDRNLDTAWACGMGQLGLVDWIDLYQLAEAYFLASTPRYLYERFRNNASLGKLVECVSVQGLIAEYNFRAGKERWARDSEDVVVAYAVLIAITFLDRERALDVFKNLDLTRLRWGEEIRNIFVG